MAASRILARYSGEAMISRALKIVGFGLVSWCLLFGIEASSAQTPDTAVLRRGINITRWFRDPPAGSSFGQPSYISDQEIEQLRAYGFTFVRLAIMPDLVQQGDGSLVPERAALLVDAMRRLEARGLGVFIVPMHDRWKLDEDERDRAKLVQFWQQLGPELQPLDSRLTFPELVNEPVFLRNPADWASLEEKLLGVVREALPDDTVVLTGNHWSNIDGLTKLKPVADCNVVYTFHFYEPPALSSHAMWDKSIDGSVLRALPFPADEPIGCGAVAKGAVDKRISYIVNDHCKHNWSDSKIQARIRQAADW